MCGQQICVLSHVDVWSTNMCIISGGCVVNKYVLYSGGCVINKYVYYLTWMRGQQMCVLSHVDYTYLLTTHPPEILHILVDHTLCVLSQVDVWSTNICIISGGCVVN